MQLCGLLLPLVVVSCLMLGSSSAEAVSTEKAHDAAASAVNSFSLALYEELKSVPGNLVVSPFSVEAVVAMLYLGLGGDTAKHVAEALYLPNDRSLVQQGFKTMFNALQNSENVTLEIANKIYVDRQFHIKDEFRQSTQAYFQSEAEEVDISHDPEGVTDTVNKWAADNTHDKIRDLLPPGTLTADVVMVLLNAIYFKGLWEIQFSKDRTSDRTFHLSSGSSKSVPMMNMETNLLYAELSDQNMRALKLPYQGGKFSMLLLLPFSNDGLREVEANIKQLDIPRILNRLNEIEVTVALPRFKILKTIDLGEPLVKLGFGEIFQSGGNFSGITDKRIYINKALQKAFIEVNEEGTEAAAVTALLDFGDSIDVIPLRGKFIADHPFLYFIIEEEKKTILFMGRVSEPEE